MIKLPELEDLDVSGKCVLVRADLDVELTVDSPLLAVDNLRLQSIKPTVDYLFDKGASKVILIGHKGRPSSSEDRFNLSLKELKEPLELILRKEVGFIGSLEPGKIDKAMEESSQLSIFLLENLRFDSGEEDNSADFSHRLSKVADCYVNEAFAVSHRNHASIVSLPLEFRNRVAAGLRFIGEMKNLSKVLESLRRPVIIIISGVKVDKLNYLQPLSKFADKILVAGRLPEYLETKPVSTSEKLLIANLIPDKEDITIRSIEKFEEEIKRAKTILVAGSIGKFEDEGHRQGTERIFRAVTANKEAFKVAGGGDTLLAINTLNIGSGFNWLSVGGGAMLEYLVKGTLPGIEALLH